MLLNLPDIGIWATGNEAIRQVAFMLSGLDKVDSVVTLDKKIYVMFDDSSYIGLDFEGI